MLLAGCAHFHRLPLPTAPDTRDADALKIDTNRIQPAGQRSTTFNARDGLDRREIVILAVLNNPDLKAARHKAGVAGAQLIQAGLLPNPQLSANFIHPTGAPGSGPLYDGYQFGLTEDITALVTRGAAKDSAAAHVRQVNLSILWQEWQTAEQAQQLFAASQAETRMLDVLHQRLTFDRQRDQRLKTAVQAGQATSLTRAPALAAVTQTNSRLTQLAEQHNQTTHQLNALLGLAPDASLHLTGHSDGRVMDRAAFEKAVGRISHRRPDLLALQAGYDSQQQKVREAVLKQFPKFSIGPTRGSDTSHVGTIGIGMTLALPLFDRNQAQIARQRATRAQLRAQYQARLDQADSKAHTIWHKTRILSRQLSRLEARLPALRRGADAARRSFDQGDLSAGSYVTLRSNALDQRIRAIRLSSQLAQSEIALDTLLGLAVVPTPKGDAS